jgi:hypothetical protein
LEDDRILPRKKKFVVLRSENIFAPFVDITARRISRYLSHIFSPPSPFEVGGFPKDCLFNIIPPKLKYVTHHVFK